MKIVKTSRSVIVGFLVLVLLATPTYFVRASPDEIAEGQHPLYIIKQVIRTNGDWTSIEWLQGPTLAVTRRSVVEGANAPGLDYWFEGLDYGIGKDDSTTLVVMRAESLVFEGDRTARLRVSKGAAGYLRVTLFFYERASGGFTSLGEIFLDEGESGPVTFEVDLSSMYETPVATASVEKALREIDKEVFAFYYQWYFCPEGPSGWLFHWNEGYADYPLMGLYDSVDERVIYAHMSMAKYAGINGLIAHYPFEDPLPAELWSTMLRIAEEMGIKLSQSGLRRQDFAEIENSISHPAFLKDSGRPVFFFYTPSAISPGQWLQYREEVEENIGPVVFIGNTINESYLGAFEGFYTYVYITTHPEDDGRAYYTHNVKQLRVGPKKMDIDDAFSLAYSGNEVPLELKTFFITVVPGYDDTNVRSPGLVRDREEGELYRKLWRTAIDLDADSVIITSWNEWHEGTELEPSTEYGFSYLNLTRVYVERYQGVPVSIPEISFSATIPSISQDPDLGGSGEILLSAGEVPALYVNVTVVGDESVSSLDLQGDFYTYLREIEGDRASILIPSVPPNSELVVSLVYEAESAGPTFNILVTAYDPFGVPYELYRGELHALRESSISASVFPDSIKIGESVTITGSVVPRRGGRTVKISYTRPDSSTFVRTVTTAVDGSFRDTYEPDAVGQWSVEVSLEEDAEYSGSTSPILYFMVEEKGCIIATSTYGSELSPEVQFLREFRDEAILKTFVGKNFMDVFNAWYYSFSPRVAEMIEGNTLLRTAMKIILYPLIGILHLAAEAYSLLSFNPEFAVLVSGLVASFLIGLAYFAPVAFVLRLIKKLRVPTKVLRASLLIWILGLCLIVIAEIAQWSGLMMFSTAMFVLSMIATSSLTFAKLLVRYNRES